MLSVKELVKLLRMSVNVEIPVPQVDEEGNPVLDDEGNPVYVNITDSNYLSMTDDDLILYLKLGVTRFLPEAESLDDLPGGSEFPVVLLAKIELYSALAVQRAEKVDMGVDNNTYLKQSQKFDHYMKLIEDARDQYKHWLENEGEDLLGTNTVTTFDVLLSKRHYSQRNYEKQPAPKVKIKVYDVTADTVEFAWSVTGTSHFARFKVYFSKDTIIDQFSDGNTYADRIKLGAKCLVSTTDIRKTTHRVTGLLPDTDYHIAVVSLEKNSVYGYAEVIFTTAAEPEEEPDVDEGEFVPDPDEEGDDT